MGATGWVHPDDWHTEVEHVGPVPDATEFCFTVHFKIDSPLYDQEQNIIDSLLSGCPNLEHDGGGTDFHTRDVVFYLSDLAWLPSLVRWVTAWAEDLESYAWVSVAKAAS